MKNLKIVPIVILCTMASYSCSTINVGAYLAVKENKPYLFKRVFIRSQQDLVYKILESNFGNPNQADTVEVRPEIVFRSIGIQNETGYYPIATEDSNMAIKMIYGNYFLNSVIINKSNETLLFPVEWTTQLPELTLSNYHVSIPNKLRKKDTITIDAGKMARVVLFGFRLRDIELDSIKFKKCLGIDINRFISGDTLREQVWIDRKEGVLLWKKYDGVTDKRVFGNFGYSPTKPLFIIPKIEF
jgi:hypothetical protein